MNEKILAMRHITVYRGKCRQVINIANFDLYYGELTAIIGQNGASKSTLLQIGELFCFYFAGM